MQSGGRKEEVVRDGWVREIQRDMSVLSPPGHVKIGGTGGGDTERRMGDTERRR